MSLDVGFRSWKSKGRIMFGGMAASKGGGGGAGSGSGSGKLSKIKRFERSNANKGIDYDSKGSIRRRSKAHHDEEEESDFSTSREDWPDEFSVHGKQDVAEMNMMFRYLGLPGPANVGIDKEAYDMVKRTPLGSPTSDGYIFRQDSDRWSLRALSPGRDFRANASPQQSVVDASPQQPVVGAFRRPHGDISPHSRSTQISTNSNSQALVDNRTPTSAGAATPIDGGAMSERMPGFAVVVRQAMLKQTRIEQEAAGVSNFISTHSVEDLPRQGSWYGSVPTPLQVSRNSPSESQSARSASGTALMAFQQIERSQSDPLSNSLRPGATPVFLGESSLGSHLKMQDVDKSENRVVQNKSAYHNRAVPSSVTVEESGPKVSGSLGSSSVSPGQARSEANSSLVEKKVPTEQVRPDGIKPASLVLNPPPQMRPDCSKPGSMVLKPPPRMSFLKIPLEMISTNEMLGSLAPDAAEDAVRSYFSDDDGNVSDSYEEQDRSNVSDAGLFASGVQPEQPSSSSNGEVIAGSVSSIDAKGNAEVVVMEPHKDLSNGDLITTNEVKKPNKGLVVELPNRVIEPEPETPQVPAGPKHPWTKGEQLGAGSFGTVYAALDSDGVFFAVKEVSMAENDKEAQQAISQLMSEIELLSRFRHDNIVQYLGTEKGDGKLYIFLELVSRGSLAAVCRAIKLSHSQIIAYTRQILKGLKYLHDRNIVHRDIKCANILVDTKGICKLADFGMAKQLDSLDKNKSCKGSAYWMAPEVIDPKKASGLAADIWSLGCSILEMATGSPPFGEMEWYRVLWTVGHGNAPPIPDTLSESAKDFINGCLAINPAKRPTATELLLHPFVRQDVALTPTTELPFPTRSIALDTIREELSADLSNASRSRATNSLSNGH